MIHITIYQKIKIIYLHSVCSSIRQLVNKSFPFLIMTYLILLV